MMQYALLSALLAGVSMVGIVLNVRNFIGLLMCVELLFLAASLNFVVFSNYFGHLDGQVMALLILAIAACESAIALGMLILMYRSFATLNTQVLSALKG